MIQEHQLQAVQLHGKETPEYCYLQSLGCRSNQSFQYQRSF
jgi:phosphoribosylanthranilate isomerase